VVEILEGAGEEILEGLLLLGLDVVFFGAGRAEGALFALFALLELALATGLLGLEDELAARLLEVAVVDRIGEPADLLEDRLEAGDRLVVRRASGGPGPPGGGA